MKEYLKGKFKQFKNKLQRKEEYDGISNKTKFNITINTLFAHEVQKLNYINGFYIFKIILKNYDNQEELIKLSTYCSRSNIMITINTGLTRENEYYIVLMGDAKSFTNLIQKYTYSIYEQSEIISRFIIDEFLLYSAIYYNIYGNLDKFDNIKYDEYKIEDSFKVMGQIPIIINSDDSFDAVWFNQHGCELYYWNSSDKYDIKLFEDKKIKYYTDSDTLVEEDEVNENFDPSIDEII